MIREYAREHQIVWRNDPSNQSNIYARNYLRNRVIDPIKSFFPAANNNIIAYIHHQKQQHQYLDKYFKQIAHSIRLSCNNYCQTFDALALVNRQEDEAIEVVRWIFGAHNRQVPKP